MPEVTVLMPVYNGERFLRPAVDSILAQTYRDFELLIVNDGSTDLTAEILKSYHDPRIRVVHNERNLGLSAALNLGLSLARGDLVARQDADDVSEPERLARQVEVMGKELELALLGTQAVAIGEDDRCVGRVERSVEYVSIRWYALVDNPFIHTSVMFRRRVIWDALGGFDPSFDPFSQDFALWSQVMARHPVRNLPDRLVRYRVRGSSIISAVEADGAPAAYRGRFERIVRELVGRNLRAMFDDTVSPQGVELMAGFVLGFDAGSIERFLALFGRLLQEFERRFPEARRSGDFARTLARQYDAVACRVSPPSRRAALKIYASGVRRRPGIVWRLSWPRVVTSVVLGNGARSRLTRLRRHRPLLASSAPPHER